MFSFFFQAEDGIRDIGVTGVQTCALPIYDVVSRDGLNRKDVRALLKEAQPQPKIIEIMNRPLERVAPWRSEERREGKSVDLGGRRIIKKKTAKGREARQEGQRTHGSHRER